MNGYDVSGAIFIIMLCWYGFKKLLPKMGESFEKLDAKTDKQKRDAGMLLDSLRTGQILIVKTWINHKEITPSLIDSIGVNRYILLTEGGLGLTLELCPNLFSEALQRQGYTI